MAAVIGIVWILSIASERFYNEWEQDSHQSQQELNEGHD